MNCFNHNNVNAIGICTNCHKGICSSCHLKGEKYLVCCEECARVVKDREEINDRAMRIYGIGPYSTGKNISISTLATLFLGLVFLAFAGYELAEGITSMGLFIGAFGLVFFILGILYWLRSKRMGFSF